MEHINQLNTWHDQLCRAPKGSSVDMDVAARLIRHGIEAHDKIVSLIKRRDDLLAELKIAVERMRRIEPLPEGISDGLLLVEDAIAKYEAAK